METPSQALAPGRPEEVDRSTRRAAVLRGPGKAEVVPVPGRRPGPGEVEVRLEGSGVCGSNLPVWEGRPWFDYPLPPGQPGHEGWGIVVAAGAGVTSPSVGERVALLSHAAFATHDVAPAENAVPLPATLKGLPFPGEALGCAMNVLARAGIAEGLRVAVVGVGFLGALLTQLASRAGARVVALSRRPYALQVAGEMGALETVSVDPVEGAVERVRRWTRGAFCDVVVEAAGLQSTLDVASELVALRGRLVIAGYHQDGLRRVNLQQWNWRGLDVVNAHEREDALYVRGMRAAAGAVARGELDVAPLLTHVLGLEELGRALDLARKRPPGFLKAVVGP